MPEISLTIHTLYTHTYAVAETLPPAMEEAGIPITFYCLWTSKTSKSRSDAKTKISMLAWPALMLSSGTQPLRAQHLKPSEDKDVIFVHYLSGTFPHIQETSQECILRSKWACVEEPVSTLALYMSTITWVQNPVKAKSFEWLEFLTRPYTMIINAHDDQLHCPEILQHLTDKMKQWHQKIYC